MTHPPHATPPAGPAAPSFTTGAIAEKLGAQLIGRADLPITHLSTLERGAQGALSFIRSRGYASGWSASRASAALISRGIEVPGHDPATRALLIVEDADLALNTILELMAPAPPARQPGRHPSACIDPAAVIAPTAHIGPGCIIEAGAVVGEGSVLIAQVYLAHEARIGRGCTLHAGVRILERCLIGDGCLLHAGVVIGADGFGFRPDPPRGFAKIPHIGNVEVGPGVEIGANSCVDRAKFGSTLIGAGTKIDNLVQIAHGVQIGRCCIICAQSGIAGSAIIGDGVMLGGQAGVADNLTVGSRAQLAAKAGAMQDVPPGEMWFGHPAYNGRQAFRDLTVLRRFAAESRTRRPSPGSGESSAG